MQNTRKLSKAKTKKRKIQMNKQEIAELSMEIVQTYYQNNTKPFLDYVDEKVLWYGPAKGQGNFYKGGNHYWMPGEMNIIP